MTPEPPHDPAPTPATARHAVGIDLGTNTVVASLPLDGGGRHRAAADGAALLAA